MKQLMHEVMGDIGSSLSPEKRIAVKEYVDRKLQIYIPNSKKALDLYVESIEKMLESYTYELKNTETDAETR
jgi:hypothetical protein